MIATILPSSTTFHAVQYNERKVEEGSAVLLEMKNMGVYGNGIPYTPDDLVEYLKLYSSMNDRVKKPQFHVAISCKGHEYSEEELLTFAHQYLHEMGYDEPGQPLLVYAHRDTDNTHLHIVTSRVSPTGAKIDHNHERRKSQKVLEKLLGQDMKGQAAADIEKAKEYSFSSVAQFCSVLSCMGYEAYEDKKHDEICVKKGGQVQQTIPLNEILNILKEDNKEKKRIHQLRAIINKYRQVCDSIDQLKHELKKNFGIDLVLMGSKESPFGYVIVDHNKKEVIKGGLVLGIKQLMQFDTETERAEKLRSFINTQVERNPHITIKELNSKLRRSHAFIKGYKLWFRSVGDKIVQLDALDPAIVNILKRNNRIAMCNKFEPTTYDEKRVLAELLKAPEDDIKIFANSLKDKSEDIEKISSLFNEKRGKELYEALHEAGFIVKRSENEVYAINVASKNIINLRKAGVDISRLQIPTSKHANRKGSLRGILSGHVQRGENREWEIEKGKDNELDDELSGSKLKM